jgi:hypothetical protein
MIELYNIIKEDNREMSGKIQTHDNILKEARLNKMIYEERIEMLNAQIHKLKAKLLQTNKENCLTIEETIKQIDYAKKMAENLFKSNEQQYICITRHMGESPQQSSKRKDQKYHTKYNRNQNYKTTRDTNNNAFYNMERKNQQVKNTIKLKENKLPVETSQNLQETLDRHTSIYPTAENTRQKNKK